MKTPTPFKTLLFLVLLVAAGGFGQQAKAQYQSFFGENTTKYSIAAILTTHSTDYDPYWLGGGTEYIVISRNDTISINGITYYQGPGTIFNNGRAYIREDTTLGRIYRYERGQEWLICDMSLSVGDTFWMPALYVVYDPNCAPLPIVVDSVFYINGLKHILFKRICYFVLLVGHEPSPLPYLWGETFHQKNIMFIEGIGPNFGPIGWDDHGCIGSCLDNGEAGDWPSPFLLCVHKDGELVFMSDERAGCWQHGPGGITEEENPLHFVLYPNPARNTINIRFEDSFPQQGTLYITDMAGRVVCSRLADTQHLKISIKDLESGLYVATWIVSGKKQSVKFIKK